MRRSRADIDAMAARLLQAADQRSAPVSVQQVFATEGVRFARNRGAGHIAGFALRHGGHRIVGVNTATSPRRERFAMAHALGHLMLHTDSELLCCHSLDVAGTGRDLVAEAEANWFAGALLMPTALLLAELEAQEKADHASRDALLGTIAAQFEVSIEACSWRLLEMGVISG